MLIPSKTREISRQIYISTIRWLWTGVRVFLLLQVMLIRSLKEGSEGGINNTIVSAVLDFNTSKVSSLL